MPSSFEWDYGKFGFGEWNDALESEDPSPEIALHWGLVLLEVLSHPCLHQS